ncbi:hypothetical protein EOM86_13840 [Candidatus Nomurabacteria bacterium]|nr:hypothetical protein [Candidatus Nomurabacteria bacterium]
MKVLLKKLDGRAVVPFKKHESDFCYDMTAISEEEVAPDVWCYGTGLSFEIQRGREYLCKKYSGGIYHGNFANFISFGDSDMNLSIDIRARSSIWKTGMVLCNSVGTVDEDYRGEVKFYFYWVKKNLPRYKVGDRIGQMKIGSAFPIEFEEKDSLDDTERGVDGFGSTGT